LTSVVPLPLCVPPGEGRGIGVGQRAVPLSVPPDWRQAVDGLGNGADAMLPGSRNQS